MLQYKVHIMMPSGLVSRRGNVAGGIQTSVTPMADDSHDKDTL